MVCIVSMMACTKSKPSCLWVLTKSSGVDVLAQYSMSAPTHCGSDEAGPPT
jgi:hypothetical protein